MGYSTNFNGQLGFAHEPSVKQIAALNAMFGEDCRDHPEWNADGLYYIDLELTEDFSAVRWNGAEKTYDLDQLVNVVTEQIRKTWPEFSFTGSLLAQGEETSDRWRLIIGSDGLASKVPVIEAAGQVECPHCHQHFSL